jgi:hypothetical protein
MPIVERITTGRAAKLGKVVEVRELTVEQWLKRVDDGRESDGISMLADMLYVDGVPIGDERLRQLGFGEIQGPMGAMNRIMGSNEDGDEDDSGNV